MQVDFWVTTTSSSMSDGRLDELYTHYVDATGRVRLLSRNPECSHCIQAPLLPDHALKFWQSRVSSACSSAGLSLC